MVDKVEEALENLESVDIYDIDLLRRFNNLHFYATKHLRTLIDRDVENIILITEALRQTEVSDKLSIQNKVLALKRNHREHSDLVDHFLYTQADLKKTKAQIKQIEEKINGIKKSIDVSPKG